MKTLLLITFFSIMSLSFSIQKSSEHVVKIIDCREFGEHNTDLSLHKDRDVLIDRITVANTGWNSGTYIGLDGKLVPCVESGYDIYAYRIYNGNLRYYSCRIDNDSLYEIANYQWLHDTISINMINAISQVKFHFRILCNIDANNVIPD